MTDPTIQRATCAAVLDVLARTDPHTTAAASIHLGLCRRALALATPSTSVASQPPTPPSAVDAVLSWCARELDRVGVP